MSLYKGEIRSASIKQSLTNYVTIPELYLKKRSEFISLNNRDWEVLSFLEQQGYATFNQLEKRYFSSKQHCSIRLKKLRAHGYIETNRPIELFLSPQERKEGKLFPYLAEYHFHHRTQIYCLSRAFRTKYAFSDTLLKRQIVIHQLLLNDLRTRLEKEIEPESILNDPKIKVVTRVEMGRHEEIRPDLSFESKGFKAAIELERTIKSKSRYYEKFLYYDSSVYTHVIYYITDRRKIEPFLKLTRQFKKIAVGYSREPEELYHNLYGRIDLKNFLLK